MYIFITIIIILISVLLGLVVLIQNPKGGGVNSTFGGASQQIFGAARTTDVVEKTTWTLGALLLLLSLFSAAFLGKTNTATAATPGAKVPTTTQGETEAEKRLKEKPSLAPTPMQQAPPAQQGAPQSAPAPKP